MLTSGQAVTSGIDGNGVGELASTKKFPSLSVTTSVAVAAFDSGVKRTVAPTAGVTLSDL